MCTFALVMETFRTIIPIKKTWDLTHADRILTMGSCFADRMSDVLMQSGFRVEHNPFGVLYNPMSVVKALETLWYNIPFRDEDVFEYQGCYASFMHHTSFSGRDKDEVLKRIRMRTTQASQALHQADCLMITFGTSWVYALAETGKIVANCHKLPDYHFVRRRLDVAEIVEYYSEFLEVVFREKPDLKILMTVSPIRHFKDGAHENTLSKAVLHLAIEELCLRFPQIVYFPAYELLCDDLRDYRFYDEDMLHPNSQALRYIWDAFSQFAFDKNTKDLIHQLQQIHKAMQHKPLRSGDEAYVRFAQKNLAAIAMLQLAHPELDLAEEQDFFKRILE